ncbi:MAG: SpoIIE family protein phosphatase [Parachlamydiaceae bacterium]|nr:SpoIIE family protein phosphatase [Parachlamydiaceae bacterium]
MTKVLVVDDEPDIEILMKQKFAKYLKSKELEFIFASNGLEALKALHQDQDINIIVTDISMPEMDGLALLSHLPELKRIFKAIIISAYGDMSNIRKAMNRGACDFITKPIDFKDLEITIFNAIEQCLTLKKAIEAQSALSDLEKELTIAGNIQESIIPHNFKPIANCDTFEILGTMIPAKHVGGDFFDFFVLDQNRLGFVIADVSGKGVHAALFMAMSRAVIKTVAQRLPSPEECLKEANRILCTDNDASMFVTAFYGILDTKNGQIDCSNAGHLPPIILSPDGSMQQIARYEGIPLGVSEDTVYTHHQFILKKDECLILYTDGITEANNIKHELYGEQRFQESLKNWKPGPLSSLVEIILDELHKFISDAQASDDITLLCLKQLT